MASTTTSTGERLLFAFPVRVIAHRDGPIDVSDVDAVRESMDLQFGATGFKPRIQLMHSAGPVAVGETTGYRMLDRAQAEDLGIEQQDDLAVYCTARFSDPDVEALYDAGQLAWTSPRLFTRKVDDRGRSLYCQIGELSLVDVPHIKSQPAMPSYRDVRMDDAAGVALADDDGGSAMEETLKALLAGQQAILDALQALKPAEAAPMAEAGSVEDEEPKVAELADREARILIGEARLQVREDLAGRQLSDAWRAEHTDTLAALRVRDERLYDATIKAIPVIAIPAATQRPASTAANGVALSDGTSLDRAVMDRIRAARTAEGNRAVKPGEYTDTLRTIRAQLQGGV